MPPTRASILMVAPLDENGKEKYRNLFIATVVFTNVPMVNSETTEWSSNHIISYVDNNY